MGISGSDPALMFALSGVARAGATRSGYTSAYTFVAIDGIQHATGRASDTSKVLIDSITVNETQGEPSTASMSTMGIDVASGQEVIITTGSMNNLDPDFAGRVLSTDQGFAAKPEHRTIDLSAIDYTQQLNRIKVIGQWSGTADAIVREIFAAYAPEWSLAGVLSGLPNIGEFTVIEPTNLTDVLTRIANRIGGTWAGSYTKRLYFGIEDDPMLTNPQPVTNDNPTFLMAGFGPIKRDRSQQVTRVHMEGGGSEAAASVPPNETILPLTDAPDTWYGDSGGIVVSGPQRIRYSGRFEGGGGSLVGPGTKPTTAPVLALASGVGVDDGLHDVTVVFVTAAGESLPSPVASITVGSLANPAVAPVAGVPQFGPGPDPGTHQFAYTEVTAAGETLPSPLSAVVTTVAGISNPSIAPTCAVATNIGLGSLTPGNSYSYKYTYANAGGFETLPSVASNTVVVTASQRLNITVPYSSDPRVTTIFFYQSDNGGAGTWKRINVHLGTATVYGGIQNYPPGGVLTVDDQSSVRTTDAPTVSQATSNSVPLTGIPPASSPLVTTKNIYGTAAGGSQLKGIASIARNATSYLVTMLDSGLGANAPTVNTADANQILATIPKGPTGTTDRRLYMSPAGGGARKRALTVANNTAVTGQISASDATLAGAAAEPASDTSGLAQPDGGVAAGATEIPLASTVDFNEDGGWAPIGNGTVVVRYSGIDGNDLTGIPETGPGSITAPISYNSQITSSPALMGVGDPAVIGRAYDQDSTGDLFVPLRAATPSTPTDRIGSQIDIVTNVEIASVTLQLNKIGTPVGTVWVTIQTGSIGPAGVVLATSDTVVASTIPIVADGTGSEITFTLPEPLAMLSGSTYYLVLQGDYTRSDTNHITSIGDIHEPYVAYYYDGTTVTLAQSHGDPLFQLGAMAFELLEEAQPIRFTIHQGDPVNLLVTADDNDAQAALSLILDPDDELNGKAGIVDIVLQDRRLSRGEALERAAARLQLQSPEDVNVGYQSLDKNTHPARTVEFDIDAPTTLTATLKVQQVTRTWVDADPPIFPINQVEAANKMETFEQLINRGA